MIIGSGVYWVFCCCCIYPYLHIVCCFSMCFCGSLYALTCLSSQTFLANFEELYSATTNMSHFIAKANMRLLGTDITIVVLSFLFKIWVVAAWVIYSINKRFWAKTTGHFPYHNQNFYAIQQLHTGCLNYILKIWNLSIELGTCWKKHWTIFRRKTKMAIYVWWLKLLI